MGKDRIDELSYAMRIAENLAGPAEAILGYQALLLDAVIRNGPSAALPDLEKIADAANGLNKILSDLGAAGDALDGDPDARKKLRHDLRNLTNAILGYGEMVFEDFEAKISQTAQNDLAALLQEARNLGARIDDSIDTDSHDWEKETALAVGLERVLARDNDGPAAHIGRVLVVDDTPANRDILTRLLEQRGHSVLAVSSAAEAFAALNKESFDLALLDILMPDVNGIEVLETLKSKPELSDLPVVMVSGLRETDAIAKCIIAGAEDYLPKPIDPVLLHARVDACLERLIWRRKEHEFIDRIEQEKERADALLRVMLPSPVIERLKAGETRIADRFDSATILFADIVDFTPLVSRSDPVQLLNELAEVFLAFDELTVKHGIEKIKTIGDAYMTAAGIPVRRPDHAQATLAFAKDMIRVMPQANNACADLSIRIGIHTGPVIAGLMGQTRSIYDVWGETVNLASRLEATGEPGRIQISETTKKAVGHDGDAFEARDHIVKGYGPVTSYLSI